MSSAVTRPTDFRATQVEETTFSAAALDTALENNRTKSADSNTMDKNMTPLILRSPDSDSRHKEHQRCVERRGRRGQPSHSGYEAG